MVDQHLHTCFSYDADSGNTPGKVIVRAVELGLEGIAITDHLDPLWPDDEFPSIIDLAGYEKALTEAEETAARTAPGFHFAKGIELGLMPVPEALAICGETVTGFPYDFVIASVHSSPESPIDMEPFLTGRSIREINEEYYSLLFESLKVYKDYDVLGHLNAIDRYTDGYAPESVYLPLADEVLRLAVSDGKGIEINTSSFRYGIGDRGTPSQAILNRFRELGGEIVTLGSDAHRVSDIGAGLSEGAAMLRAAGFTRYAVFKNRKPTFVKI
ncbi:phosphatase [Clostridia bacterium]|nr:phosphatase [Clostridia bacterium]